jgi:small subunit ribosomal protein S6
LNIYEGLFLLNSVEAKRDWEAMTAHVKGVLTKHGAEIGTNYRWDERKLAYDIRQQKRGTYYLVYFRCPPQAIASIRRDCDLSDLIIRELILRWEGEMPPMPTDEELARHQADLAAILQPGHRF